jgi:hypothetical protein
MKQDPIGQAGPQLPQLRFELLETDPWGDLAGLTSGHELSERRLDTGFSVRIESLDASVEARADAIPHASERVEMLQEGLRRVKRLPASGSCELKQLAEFRLGVGCLGGDEVHAGDENPTGLLIEQESHLVAFGVHTEQFPHALGQRQLGLAGQ